MKATDATFIEEKNKPENNPIFLYSLFDYDGASNNLHFAAWDADVVFDGITYTKFPIKHEFIKSNTSGQIDGVRIVVGNASRLIQAYLETYELRGLKFKIKIVFGNQLADATAFVDEAFYVESYQADEENVTFNVSSKFDIMDLELPKRRYMRKDFPGVPTSRIYVA